MQITGSFLRAGGPGGQILRPSGVNDGCRVPRSTGPEGDSEGEQTNAVGTAFQDP